MSSTAVLRALGTAGALVGAGVVALAVARRLQRYDLAGRRVLLSGGSRGLGFELARQLLAQGARVAILGRDAASLERAEERLRELGEVHAIPCDVRDPQAIERAVSEARRALGSIDVLINNAGSILCAPLEHQPPEELRDQLAVHVEGPYRLVRACLDDLRHAPGGGRVVNVASIGGKVAIPHLLAYSASKFGLVGLSHALHTELARQGVHVTTVCPGLMRTGSPPNARFAGHARAEYAWFAIGDSLPLLSMNAERAARQIVSALRRGTPEVVLGLPARAAALAGGVAPSLVTRLNALVARLLPGPAPAADTPRSGWESQSSLAPSFLTRLSQQAMPRLNQAPPASVHAPRAA